MRDLRADLRRLPSAIQPLLPREGGGVVLFVGAETGDGASSVAASYALAAADRAERPVWLLDLDLVRNGAHEAFEKGAFARIFGEVGPAYAAGLRSTPFYVLAPEDPPAAAGANVFTVHRIGDTRMMVTRFHKERLAPQQGVRIRSHPDYWKAVREATQLTVVDAPPLSESAAALAVAPHADAVVLVVRADRTLPEDAQRLRRELETHGGRIAGVVMTRVKTDALRAEQWRR